MIAVVRKFFNLFFSNDKALVRKLQTSIGIVPANIALYKQAFLHSSSSKATTSNNERLEYLGDAVLDAIISEILFNRFPKKTEGFLTETRAKIVSRKKLGQIAKNMGIGEYLKLLNKNIIINTSSSILGNTLEALIGAVYLDAGYKKTYRFIVHKIVKPHVDLEKLVATEFNFKSRLVERCQKNSEVLAFEIVNEKEYYNYRIFKAQIVIEGKVIAFGEGRNKKTAENEAARKALEVLINSQPNQ